MLKIGRIDLTVVVSLLLLLIKLVAASRNPSPARVSLLKKKVQRQEQLCPFEYQSCFCDYTSVNNEAGAAAAQENLANRLQMPASASHLAPAKSSAAYAASLSFSIMIDCQHYGAEAGGASGHQINNQKMPKTANNKTSVLKIIPRIQTSSSNPAQQSNKFKYLSHVTHLDLSRTAIPEVPTDAFFALTGLQTIVITHCKQLTKIRMFAFRNLPNLKVLIITNNPGLHELEPHSFGSLRNLNYLSLGANRLSHIDGYIFSVSSSIKIIDFIGNPIKRIKSHAFHGLRNVTDLFLSLDYKRTPIEAIEGDSFISTAFVDHIYLDGVHAKTVATNAFRGLSYCKNLHMSNTFVEEIEANAFYRANNIQKLVMRNSRLKRVNRDAFRGVFNVDLIDLRGNYLNRIDQATFEHLLPNAAAAGHPLYKNDSSSIVLIDEKERAADSKNSHRNRKLQFEQNPIQCDCNLMWILNSKLYSSLVGLPEICAGPKGYDCLRLVEVTKDKVLCSNRTTQAEADEFKLPCDDLVFDVDKSADVFSVAAPKGRKKTPTSGGQKDDDDEDEDTENTNNNNNKSETDTAGGDDYTNNSNVYPYDNSEENDEVFTPNGGRTTTISANLFENNNNNNNNGGEEVNMFMTATRPSTTSKGRAGGSGEMEKAVNDAKAGIKSNASSSLGNLVNGGRSVLFVKDRPSRTAWLLSVYWAEIVFILFSYRSF